jgi:hypothetical protein
MPARTRRTGNSSHAVTIFWSAISAILRELPGKAGRRLASSGSLKGFVGNREAENFLIILVEAGGHAAGLVHRSAPFARAC